MLIAQISDPHITSDGTPGIGGGDPGAAFAATIEAILALDRLPDLVVCTGDIAYSGTREEYERADSIARSLPMPFLPLVGNHDDRAHLAEVFGVKRSGEFVQYAVEDFPVRILVLDTLTPGSMHASYCSERLEWLKSTLPDSAAPTVVAMHHPPFAEGVSWIRPADPNWSSGIATLLRDAPYVKRIIAGHVHRAMQREWAGVSATTAPSIAPHAALNLVEGAPPLLDREAPGFQLHQWENADFTSYTISLTGFLDRFKP